MLAVVPQLPAALAVLGLVLGALQATWATFGMWFPGSPAGPVGAFGTPLPGGLTEPVWTVGALPPPMTEIVLRLRRATARDEKLLSGALTSRQLKATLGRSSNAIPSTNGNGRACTSVSVANLASTSRVVDGVSSLLDGSYVRWQLQYSVRCGDQCLGVANQCHKSCYYNCGKCTTVQFVGFCVIGKY